MKEKFFSLLKEIGLPGFIDIILMSGLIYAILAWFKRKRAVLILVGVLILGLVYLLAYQFKLILTTTVLQGFFAVLLIALIIIFQEEVRSFFERLGQWSVKGKSETSSPPPTEIEVLVSTLTDLARKKVGALLVIRGKDLVDRHLEGGVPLDGKISESILMSIFDPHSRGHDGAVVIDRQRITDFGCHLPLSKNFEKLREMGTRHAAALGLTEVSDALCLVISEEKGTISVAQRGEIKEIHNPDHLREVLGRFYGEILPPEDQKSSWEFLKKNYPEKIAAVVISITLWFLVVHESRYIVRSFKIPVEYFQLAPHLMVKSIEPDEVVATFSGPQNSFHFLSDKNIRLTVKLTKTEPGSETVSLTKSDFNFPKEISLENIEPHNVVVTFGAK